MKPASLCHPFIAYAFRWQKTEKSFLAIAVCFQMHHDDTLDGVIFPVVFRPFVLIFGNSNATATWLEIFFRLTGDQWKEETDPFVTFPQQCVFILPLPLGFILLLNFLEQSILANWYFTLFTKVSRACISQCNFFIVKTSCAISFVGVCLNICSLFNSWCKLFYTF